jgi:hypothetical protein
MSYRRPRRTVVALALSAAALCAVAAPASAKISVAVSGGVLTISGSDGDDTVGVAAVNGSPTLIVFDAKEMTASSGCRVYWTRYAACGAAVTRVVFNGGAGNDSFAPASIEGSVLQVPVEAHGGAGNDTLAGAGLDDLLDGGDGDDAITGAAGKDSIDLGAGNDYGSGGSGDDTILGGPGSDRLAGVTGADVLDGGPGTDVVGADHEWSAQQTKDDGWYGAWSKSSPGGNDTIRIRDGERDQYLCGPGQDTVTADTVDAEKKLASPSSEDACETVEHPAPVPLPTPPPGSGGQPVGGQPGSGGGGTVTPPGGGAGGGTKPGSGVTQPAIPVREITRTVQKLGFVLRKGVLVGIETDRVVRWRIDLFEVRTGPRGKRQLIRIGRHNVKLPYAGGWTVRTYVSTAAYRRLSRRRTVQVLVRSTVTDVKGAKVRVERTVTLRR